MRYVSFVCVATPDRSDNADSPRVLSKDFGNSPLHRFRVAGSRNYQNICPPNHTLHVANLPGEATEEDVQTLFGNYGTIMSVRFLPKYVFLLCVYMHAWGYD